MASDLATKINNNSPTLVLVVLVCVFMIYTNYMSIQKVEMAQEDMCPKLEGMGCYEGDKRGVRLPIERSDTGGEASWGDSPLKCKKSAFQGGHEPPVFWPIGDVSETRAIRSGTGYSTTWIDLLDEDGKVMKDDKGNNRLIQVVVDPNGNIINTAGLALDKDLSNFNRIKVVNPNDDSQYNYHLCAKPQNAYNSKKGCHVKSGMADEELLAFAEGFYSY